VVRKNAVKIERNYELENRRRREARSELKEQVADGRIPRGAYSILEFCASVGISEGFYHKAKRAGLGPRETHVLDKILISEEARREWLEQHQAAEPSI
jgi:hypothetical protein